MRVSAAELEGALARRSSPYTSSHGLEEVDLELADGTRLDLVLKSRTVSEIALEAKPGFLVDAGREQRLYETVLPAAGDAAPAFFGVVDDELVLERIAGSPLTEIGDPEVWDRAMRRIAELHEALAGSGAVGLVEYDETYYARWLERARAFAGADVRALETSHARAVERLLELPQTVIHGELYASNVIVADDRICAVDWETAALGPEVVDVAALTSGSWSESERERLALAYLDARASHEHSASEFLEHVWCARLHIAVQWLGWSASWKPPPEQAHDWLAEATAAAKRT